MASTLTLAEARKILGKLADNISDEELEQEIKTAQILKSIFFGKILDKTNNKQKNTN